MRALILVLAVLAVGLSVSILLHKPPALAEGPVLMAGRMISDAQEGEEATYADSEGYRLTYRVEKTIPGGPDRPPSLRVRRTIVDATGRPVDTATYDHLPTVHGLFPLVAPDDPHGFDRIWVWQRIRREVIDWRGKRHEAWRFDCIDPGLPPDADTVVAWMDEGVPCFGLLRWSRGGRTWSLVETGR